MKVGVLYISKVFKRKEALFAMAHIEQGIHENSKTYRSFDPLTVCQRQLDGEPCLYCYVQAGRDNNFCAKDIIRVPIKYVDYIKEQMTDYVVDKLNGLGGIRMFSYSDYFSCLDGSIGRFLDDCLDRGLNAKAITKEEDFIDEWHSHPALNMIHVSVDFLYDVDCDSSPISLTKAKSLRDKYDKVCIRGVFLNNDALDKHSEDVDIITLNHALFNSPDQVESHLFSKEERRQVTEDNFGKVCASGPSGKCKDCPTKCGTSAADISYDDWHVQMQE